MQGSRVWVVPAAALLLAFGGCESSDQATWITESDNGKTIEAWGGDTLKVKLWGNPTTGYSWTPAPVASNILALEAMDFEADSDDTGAGGFFCFRYRAGQAGTTAVHMVYARVFEPSLPPAGDFRVTVVVQP